MLKTWIEEVSLLRRTRRTCYRLDRRQKNIALQRDIAWDRWAKKVRPDHVPSRSSNDASHLSGHFKIGRQALRSSLWRPSLELSDLGKHATNAWSIGQLTRRCQKETRLCEKSLLAFAMFGAVPCMRRFCCASVSTNSEACRTPKGFSRRHPFGVLVKLATQYVDPRLLALDNRALKRRKYARLIH
jgi:hypothetical protein